MNINAEKAIRPEQLTQTIAEMLNQWYGTEERKFFEAIDDSARKCNEAAKSYLSKGHGIRTGEYIGHFKAHKIRARDCGKESGRKDKGFMAGVTEWKILLKC